MEDVSAKSSDSRIKDSLQRCLDALSHGFDTDDAIQEILAALGEHYGGDRAYVFEFDRASGSVEDACEWCREGVPSQLDELDGMRAVDFSAWSETMADDRVSLISRGACHSGKESPQKCRLLEVWGLESLLIAPLWTGKRLAGYLTVDNPSLLDGDYVVLRTVALYVANHIDRREGLEQRMVAALRSVYVGMYLWDFEAGLYHEVENGLHSWRAKSRVGPLSEIPLAIDGTVDPMYLKQVHAFLDIDNLRRTLCDRDDVSMQYLTGEVGWVMARVIVVERDERGLPAKVLFSIEDIDEAKRSLELASYRAEHDALTGLLNRSALDSLMVELRSCSDPLAVVLLDVDKFKGINDRFGHGVGDDVLRAVARALVSSMRSGDKVIRLGGDEFAVILRDCPSSFQGKLLRRVDAINQLLSIRDNGIPVVSVSAGVAFGEYGYDRDLLSCADRALYRAKRSPEQCCVYNPELDG